MIRNAAPQPTSSMAELERESTPLLLMLEGPCKRMPASAIRKCTYPPSPDDGPLGSSTLSMRWRSSACKWEGLSRERSRARTGMYRGCGKEGTGRTGIVQKPHTLGYHAPASGWTVIIIAAFSRDIGKHRCWQIYAGKCVARSGTKRKEPVGVRTDEKTKRGRRRTTYQAALVPSSSISLPIPNT
jgi:hypothetical protein